MLLAWACLIPAAWAQHTHLDARSEAERQAWLAEARAALSRGTPEAAKAPLEAAERMSHAADTELLTLQAQLQSGEFRQALAFAAHTADAHRDEPAARELHLWLMALSGHAEAAVDRLATAPVSPSLATALQALKAGAAADRLNGPFPSPWAHGEALPAGAVSVSTGLLIQQGSAALVPAEAAPPGAALWLRNGLGRSARATSLPLPAQEAAALSAVGLTVVRVEPPLQTPPGLTRAPRPAFAGSPAVRIGALRRDTPAPSWPLLQAGFLGRVSLQGTQSLGWPQGPAHSGGPVFDRAGRLIGLALPGTGTAERFVPALSIPPLSDLPVTEAAPARPLEELYEAALPLVVEVYRL